MSELFVSRQSELKRLWSAADEARNGPRRVVLLAGEPGIGKSRLVRELDGYASNQGAIVCWGRSREAAGAPPYWPWIQVGRSLGDGVDAGTRGAALRPDAAILQRIFPEIREFLDDVGATPETADAVAARFQLFEAVTRLFRRAAERQPLVLVLEDLHWADQATHLLFTHLAAGLGSSSVLLIGTYRDGELTRNDSLSALVAELNREPGFESLSLQGLHRDDVIRYFDEVGGPGAASRLGVDVHELTAGNPFFVEQLANLVAAEGPSDRGAGQRMPLPDGIRAVLRRRLGTLSVEGAELLALAAVVGFEFSYPLLAMLVPDQDDDRVVTLLEEATAARIIEEIAEPGRYRFVHALMHETLLTELSATRRARIHGQVGEALEQHRAGRLDQYASRLAAHFVESAAVDPEHAERAFRYSELAGRQAEAETAWDPAVVHYEHALELLSQQSEDEAHQAELLVRLGRCYRVANRVPDAWRTLLQAIDALRTLKDPRGQARATLELTRVLGPPQRAIALVAEALAVLPAGEPQLEARLHADLLRGARRGEDDEETTAAHRTRALELAKSHSLPDVEAAIAHGDLITAELAGDYPLAADLGVRAHQLFQAAGLPVMALDPLTRAAGNALLAGQVERADDLARTGFAEARGLHDRQWTGGLGDILIATALCRADIERLRSTIAEQPDPTLAQGVLIRQHVRLALGDVDGALADLDEPNQRASERLVRPLIHATRARLLFMSGDPDAAAGEYELMNKEALERVQGGFSYGLAERRTAAGWEYASPALTMLGPAFAVLAPKGLQRDWFDSNPPLPPFDATGSPLLLLGQTGVALGEYERAGEILEDLLAIAERERAPLVAAGCHLAFADIAEARMQSVQALEQLEAAVATLERHQEFALYEAALSRLEEARAASSNGGRRRPDGLSEREVEVIQQLADGKTNAQVGELLVISPGTVGRHVSNILNKTGLSNRTQLARYATEHGLLDD